MTAKEWIEKYDKTEYCTGEVFGEFYFEDSTIENMLKDFAKMHVKLALKEALESISCLGSSTDIATYEEVEKAVLNSYNLENIK